MSSSITEPAADSNVTSAIGNNVTSPSSKGKGKAQPPANEPMKEEDDEDEDEDDDEEDEDDEGEEDDEEEEETLDDVDPSLIVPGGRRTRGIRIDYTANEVWEKAGLATANEDDDEDDDGDVDMK